jgi:PASTA domain
MTLSIPARRFRPIAAIAVAAAFAALLIGSSAAHATCYSSTPSGTAYADSPADGDLGLAPEITTVAIGLDAACAYSVNPGIPGTLIDGDGVFAYIDADGNPATGSPTFDGADVAIGSIGVTGPDPAPLLGRWDAAAQTFSFAGAPSLTPAGTGGFSASLDQLGVAASPTTTRVRVATIWTGVYDNYFDFAPESPQAPIALPIAFSTVAPPAPVVAVPPPAPPAPPAPVAAPAPPASAPVTSTAVTSCKVPSVKRLRTTIARTAIRDAGCKLGLVQRSYSASVAAGRVIASLPKAGTRGWSQPVDLVVSNGRRPKQRKKAHRATAADVRVVAEIAARRLDAAAR